MLLIVSPNLAMDRILEVADFRAGHVQRSRNVITQPGGKGSNVARVFRQLGGEVALVGFVGRRNGGWIRDSLARIGVQIEAIEAYDGESRVCTIIADAACAGHPTVINEESPAVEPQAVDVIHAKIDGWLGKAKALLTTGSLSRRLPEDFYATVIRSANGRGILTAVDAAGVVLRRALAARPALLKANVEEVAGVFGSLPEDPWDIAKRMDMDKAAPPQTIVTFGERGALLTSDGDAWRVTPPRISKVNPIGAGDAFAAGYLKAVMDGRSPEDALRFAAAVAASDASTLEPGCIVPSELDSLLREARPAEHRRLRKT